MAALLELKDVHTFIAGFHILQGITIEAQQGVCTVLLGRNGAGKTTTLRTLLGFNPPQKGAIYFDNKKIDGLAPYNIAKLGIGYVPENRDIFGGLSVKENFKVAARDGLDVMEQKLEKVFTLFPDLKKAYNQRAGTLSGGQQQMLAIGRVLVSENKILIIDEPSSGLAPIIVDRVAEVVRELKKETSILLVEQNYNMARSISDNYFIIDHGKCVHQGRMAELDELEELKKRYLGVAM